MNGKRGDEGLAIADMALTYNFPHISILVQLDFQYDGFYSAVKNLFIKSHEGETNEIVFKQEDTVNSLLIELESSMSSRVVSMLQHLQQQHSKQYW